MKRLFCIIGSLLVCTSSAFAWNAESFLAGASEEFTPYVSDPVVESDVPMLMMSGAPVMMSSAAVMSADTSSSAEVYEVDWDLGTWDFHADKRSDQLFSMLVNYAPIVVSPSLTLPGGTGLDLKDAPIYKSESSIYNSWRTNSVLFNPLSGIEDVSYVSMAEGRLKLPVNLDHIPANSKVFEFSLNLASCFVRGYHNGSVVETVYPSTLDVYLNGSKVKSFGFSSTGSLDISSELISVNSAIQDAYFVITVPQLSLQDEVSLTSDNYYIWWSYFPLASSITYSFLDGSGIIQNDIFNNEAGAALDEHSSIESQWSGSMTDNFNSLNIADFVYPDGLIMAYALISGIFLDLWNGLGEYKILYVFPLTLGICLLLIGRISKFGGQASSGSRRRAGGPASKPSGGPSKGGGG